MISPGDQKMKILSIIVPVFNGALHLRKFVESATALIQQDAVELVFVDDGSTDQTPNLLSELGDTYKNIRVITVANGGQGRAKNLGAASAEGQYFWFADADDALLVESDAEEFIRFIESSGAEVIVTGYSRVDAQTGRVLDSYAPTMSTESPALKLSSTDVFGHSAWNKIVRRDIFLRPDHAFLEGRIHEDLAVVPLWVINADVVKYDSSVRYLYGVHASSSIHGNYSRHADLLFAITHLVNNCKHADERIGPSIMKELFFYSLPRYAGGVGTGCPVGVFFKSFRDTQTLYRSIPAPRRRVMLSTFSAAEKFYVRATAAFAWPLPFALSALKTVSALRKTS